MHRWDNESYRAHPSTEGSKPGWQKLGRVPCCRIIVLEIVLPEPAVFDKQDRNVCSCPVSDEPQEVGECVVKFGRANDREGYHTVK